MPSQLVWGAGKTVFGVDLSNAVALDRRRGELAAARRAPGRGPRTRIRPREAVRGGDRLLASRDGGVTWGCRYCPG